MGRHREGWDFVNKCSICKVVKAEHHGLAGELQALQILELKWEDISMDFIGWITKDLNRLELYLGCGRSPNKKCSLFAREKYRPYGEVNSIVCIRNSATAWSSKDDHIRLGYVFYLSFFARPSGHNRYQIKIQ